MQLLNIPVEGYDNVIQCQDTYSGLSALISIHNATYGPALGGMRMWPYATWNDALQDVNRLAQGMTYKSAVAETGFGGGKAVIIGEPWRHKTARLLQAMGRFVDTLKGQYIAGEDVGTTVEDMRVVRQETPHVVGLPRSMGGSGDPAPFTALGVFLGLQACVTWALQAQDLRGIRVAVQGCGNVATHLCQHLHQAGALITVTDVVIEKAQRLAQLYGAAVVAPEAIYDVPCEVYAPCALGGTLNDDTILRLQCQVVAGSANNQCLRAEHAEILRQRTILYAPDFVINAGGLLNDEQRVLEKVRNIARTLQDVLSTAARQDMSTHEAAIQLAEHKLHRARPAISNHDTAVSPAIDRGSRSTDSTKRQRAKQDTFVVSG